MMKSQGIGEGKMKKTRYSGNGEDGEKRKRRGNGGDGAAGILISLIPGSDYILAMLLTAFSSESPCSADCRIGAAGFAAESFGSE